MSNTITETVEERLNPKPINYLKDDNLIRRRTISNSRAVKRSSSLNKFKKLPMIVLCSKAVIGSHDILQWIYESRTNFSVSISHYQKQIRSSSFAILLYSALILILGQVLFVFYKLLTTNILPMGFLFLLFSITTISYLGRQLTFYVPRQCRSRSRTKSFSDH